MSSKTFKVSVSLQIYKLIYFFRVYKGVQLTLFSKLTHYELIKIHTQIKMTLQGSRVIGKESKKVVSLERKFSRSEVRNAKK